VLAFADRVFIAAQLGSEAVGIYTAAYSLARMVRELFIPISTALLPAATRAWDQGDKERGRWFLFNTLHYYATFALPALVGLSVLGPLVLRFLAPATAGRDVGWLILFMGVGYFSSGLEAGLAIVLQIVKQTKALAISRGTAAVVYVILVVVSVSAWGLLGGALATGTAYLIELGLTYWLARRYERIGVPIKQSIKGVIAAAGMAVIVWWIDPTGVLEFFLAVVVGALTYGTLMIVMKGLGQRELRFVVSFLSRRKADGPP
jgi:stage V sporulation protein B